MTTVDCVNVLRGGVVEPAEFENGSWRYRVRTAKIYVVVAFRSGGQSCGRDGVEDQVTCTACGAPMKTKRENFRYDAVGLPGITLNGVEVSRCPRCGEYEVAIPQTEELHRAIAHAIIGKRERLTPAEIRFLRKYLGWSGGDFAAHIGSTPETVSRWEHGGASMGVTADRLLRLMVASRQPTADYALETLRIVARMQPKPIRLRVEVKNGHWRAQAA